MNILSNHITSGNIYTNHQSLTDISTINSLNKENLMREKDCDDNDKKDGSSSNKCLQLVTFQVESKGQGPDPGRSCKSDSEIVGSNSENNFNIGISSNIIHSNSNSSISLNTNRKKNIESQSDDVRSSDNNTDSNRKVNRIANSNDEKKKRKKKNSEKQKTSRMTFPAVKEGSFITDGDSLAQELNSAAECFFSGSKDHPIAVE